MFFIIFATVIALAIAANVYDIVMTERGIKAGVAVESFTMFVGSKPTALALALRDLGVLVVACAPAVVFAMVGDFPLAYGMLAAPAVAAVKHVMGGRAWAKLLKK